MGNIQSYASMKMTLAQRQHISDKLKNVVCFLRIISVCFTAFKT